MNWVSAEVSSRLVTVLPLLLMVAKDKYLGLDLRLDAEHESTLLACRFSWFRGNRQQRPIRSQKRRWGGRGSGRKWSGGEDTDLNWMGVKSRLKNRWKKRCLPHVWTPILFLLAYTDVLKKKIKMKIKVVQSETTPVHGVV